MAVSEIALIVAVLIFAALVFFLVRFLLVANETLKKSQQVMEAVEKHLQEVGDQPATLIRNLNELSVDLRTKLNSVQPWVRILSDVGSGLEHKASSFKDRCQWQCLKEKMNPPADKTAGIITDVLECALSIVSVWNKAKERR